MRHLGDFQKAAAQQNQQPDPGAGCEEDQSGHLKDEIQLKTTRSTRDFTSFPCQDLEKG